MAYTALAYYCWASFHDVYRSLRHAHYQYRPHLPYKSHTTYLTNHMESISHHFTPLVVHSLGGGHICKHTCIQTFADRRNYKKLGALRPTPGLKLSKMAGNSAIYPSISWCIDRLWIALKLW